MNKDIQAAVLAERRRIIQLLDGIDREEKDGGWWESSYGAEFGANILKKINLEVIDAINALFARGYSDDDICRAMERMLWDEEDK